MDWLVIAAAILVLLLILALPIVLVFGCIRIAFLLFRAARDAERRQRRESLRRSPRRFIEGRRSTTRERAHKRPPLCLEAFGLTASASPEEIVAAYRQMALTLHPDRGGNLEDFKRLQRNSEQALAYS